MSAPLAKFNPAADRRRDALPAGLRAVVFDASSVPHAYLESVARLERGERFYALPLFDDLRVSAYTTAAASISAISDRAPSTG